ncbi:MAG: helix-turn-helix domain-containing protein [Rhodobiaceae bacterium]|nr:helix-turn-helix domain-containing protein [Rhodobiaceae bacterium]
MASKKTNRRGRRVNTKGRNENEQYARLPYRMAQHPVFRGLSGNALKIWIELRCRYNGSNNGKLFLSLGEAAKLLGMGKSSADRAFKELEHRGFIVKTKQGYWYGRQATEWRTTDVSCDGHLATRDWQHAKPLSNGK